MAQRLEIKRKDEKHLKRSKLSAEQTKDRNSHSGIRLLQAQNNGQHSKNLVSTDEIGRSLQFKQRKVSERQEKSEDHPAGPAPLSLRWKTSTDEGKRTSLRLPGQDLGCFSHCLHSPHKIQGSTINDQGWKMSLFPSHNYHF